MVVEYVSFEPADRRTGCRGSFRAGEGARGRRFCAALSGAAVGWQPFLGLDEPLDDDRLGALFAGRPVFAAERDLDLLRRQRVAQPAQMVRQSVRVWEAFLLAAFGGDWQGVAPPHLAQPLR